MIKRTGSTSCQWMGAEQHPYRLRQVHFCKKPTIKGSSYCSDHFYQVYQKNTSTENLRKSREVERFSEYLEDFEKYLD